MPGPDFKAASLSGQSLADSAHPPGVTTATLPAPTAPFTMAGLLLQSDGAAGSGERRAVLTPPENIEQAYALYVDCVWGTLRRLGVPSAALEDAVQDVFMTAHRRWDEFRHASSRRTWIIGIAVRVAANHRRRNVRDAQRQAPNDVDTLSHESQSSTPANAFEQYARREASDFLNAFVEELPDGQREVFILADVEQLTIRETADACGVSFSTCYKRLQIARRRFNEAVKRHQVIDGRRLR